LSQSFDCTGDNSLAANSLQIRLWDLDSAGLKMTQALPSVLGGNPRKPAVAALENVASLCGHPTSHRSDREAGTDKPVASYFECQIGLALTAFLVSFLIKSFTPFRLPTGYNRCGPGIWYPGYVGGI
jgi:hypothetical protein